MNRNNESHFIQVPETHVSRTRFNRDQNILTTFDAGKLVPFYVDEVLPGDTFNVSTAAIIRMTTPKYPVFDDAFIDFYYFYCPNRILWDNFKRFMGEADETPWMPEKTYKVPTIRIGNGTSDLNYGPKEGSILDYMGVPTDIYTKEKNVKFEVNALPVRAYVKIWNEFFRDQNVSNPATLTTGDESVIYVDDNITPDNVLLRAQHGGRCLPVNKFHDYFTSCLPYPQRGPETNIPIQLEGTAPVYAGDKTNAKTSSEASWNNLGLYNELDADWSNAKNGIRLESNGTPITDETSGMPNNQISLHTSLYEASAVNITINQLRQAFAVQHYYEALARGGSRYREQVRALFGVSISDKTVQVPEYLGGGRYHVNINQIVQTSGQQAANDTPIGETGAMSVTPINESSFTKSFEEHGFVIGVMCVRHNHSYQQGLERFWSRSDRLDYYFPQFANLGEQPVKKKEIMITGEETDDETFGYQEAWAEYRMKPNRVSGKMRSNAEGTLDFWHYADKYDTVPTLSQEWMNEGKAEIARTLIEQNEPQFFGAIRVMNKTTRCMPLYSVPGLEKL